MANNFLHNEEGVSSSITDLKDALESYQLNVDALEDYIANMDASNQWQDDDVKTSFINAAQGYIKAYRLFSSGIEGYIECLEKKSNNIALHESNFSK